LGTNTGAYKTLPCYEMDMVVVVVVVSINSHPILTIWMRAQVTDGSSAVTQKYAFATEHYEKRHINCKLDYITIDLNLNY